MKSGQETGSAILHTNAMGFSALKHISFCPCNIQSVSPKNKNKSNKTKTKKTFNRTGRNPKINIHFGCSTTTLLTHQPNKKMVGKNPPIL